MDTDPPESDIAARHKQERKDLQSQIQGLKKSVPKGDKKKKKEIADEIAKLEQELDAKHQSELGSQPPEATDEPPEVPDEKPDEDAEGPPMRLSRAAKRRNKKSAEAKERDQRICDQEQANKTGPRIVEMNAIKEALKKIGLQLYNIPADGNCLYCAVNHQLERTGREAHTVAKLRKLTADFMRANKDDFLPFMYNDSEETLGEQDFENYCKEVANTKLWGGQLELRALSNILTCPIKVIQATGPPTVQGEQFTGPELILAYHRHLYRLGEHYNSTVSVSE